MIKAVLFDLDGVLVNACEWHYQALNQALRQIVGSDIPEHEHITGYNGLPTKQKLHDLLKRGIITEDQVQPLWELKQQLTIETITQQAQIDPVKIEMLQFLNDSHIYAGCVTNSIYLTARLMLEKTGQLSHLDYLISNDMVRYPKPHGEGYIMAMVKFSASPSQTLIVEDSPKGIQAAQTTGAEIWEVADFDQVNLANLQAKLGL